MNNHATPEGTQRFAERFRSQAGEGHFRRRETAGGLTFSSLGMGTYLGQPDERTDAAYTEAAVAAVEGGLNLLDSAINYRFQRSERSLRAALEELAKKGYAREELILCTKGGYLTPDANVPADANEYFFREYIQRGIFGAKDIAAGCHCMAPRFLEDQLQRSLHNLGVESIDVYYLHNPETQLAEISRPEFLTRARAAFAFLESAAAKGKIQSYGLATWNGCRQEAQSREALQLAEFVQLAREIAGDAHRFRYIQLPFNLAMTEALTLANQTVEGRARTMVEAADALGVTLIGSASLLQGQVARNLPPFVREALGFDSDDQCALQFARSSPGITAALVGMSSAAHARKNASLTGRPVATVEQFTKLFERGSQA